MVIFRITKDTLPRSGRWNLKKVIFYFMLLKPEPNAQPINNNHSFSLYNFVIKAVRIAIQKKLSKL